jgi:uncharacterized protein
MNLGSEIFAIPLDEGSWIVYAPLHGVAFAANQSLVNALSAHFRGVTGEHLDKDLLTFLTELRLLERAELPVAVRRGDPAPTDVTLFLTTACNLRCTYCYASAGDSPAQYMSMDVARRGIDFVIDNARRQGSACVGVNYHGGGEPTVHWRLMTESLEYARKQADGSGLEVIAASASNGVLNDGQIDWIIGNLNGGVSLSFDGLPEAHDRHRMTVAGKGSSTKVTHTMSRFDQAGYPYAVRLTVTADQIPVLADSVEFVLSHFKPVRIQVEPAYQLGRGAGKPSAETRAFVDAFRQAQARADRFGHEVMYSAARVGMVSNHFCGVSQDGFSLTPAGRVSGCYEAFNEENPFADVFLYGRPARDGTGYDFDLKTLGRLRDLGVENRPFCQGCFAKWNCAGDCYHKSLATNGRGEFAGSERCHITRELTKDQLLTRIADSGGLVWRDPGRHPCSVHASAAVGGSAAQGATR